MADDWKIQSVGVIVKDLDKTVDYYQSMDIANFEPGTVEAQPHSGELVYGKPASYTTREKMVQIGNLTFELIQPVNGDGPQMGFLNKYGEGIQYVSFTVDDLDKEGAKLVAKGAPVIFTREDKGSTCFDTGKVGNVLVELVQRRETAAKKPAASKDWRVFHVGIVMSDMDEILDYYQSLDIAIFDPARSEPRRVTEELVHGKLVPFSVRMKQTKMGDVTAEMIQPVEGMGPHMEFLNSRSEGGAHHIGFLVDNLEQERAKLVAKGIPIVLINKTRTFFTYFNTAKVGNVQIELVQWDQMRFPRPAGPGQ